MSASVTFIKKVAASDMQLAATCLPHMEKIFQRFREWKLNSYGSCYTGGYAELRTSF